MPLGPTTIFFVYRYKSPTRSWLIYDLVQIEYKSPDSRGFNVIKKRKFPRYVPTRGVRGFTLTSALYLTYRSIIEIFLQIIEEGEKEKAKSQKRVQWIHV